jgi:hypothetical protein
MRSELTPQINRTKPIPIIHPPISHYIPVPRHSSDPTIMSSVRASSASPSSSSSRKAVKASATASAPSSRPPTRSSSDPYYGHEETAVLCARFVSLLSPHDKTFSNIRSLLFSSAPTSLPQRHPVHLLLHSLTLSPTLFTEHGCHPSSPSQHYFSFSDSRSSSLPQEDHLVTDYSSRHS